MPLVVVGDSSFSDRYTTQTREMAALDPRVVLTGFAHGDLLSELYQHAALFVQPSLVEGLPLTLLEAASHGTPVLASDIAPHVQVLGESGGPGRRLFAADDAVSLTTALVGALADPPGERAAALISADTGALDLPLGAVGRAARAPVPGAGRRRPKRRQQAADATTGPCRPLSRSPEGCAGQGCAGVAGWVRIASQMARTAGAAVAPPVPPWSTTTTTA